MRGRPLVDFERSYTAADRTSSFLRDTLSEEARARRFAIASRRTQSDFGRFIASCFSRSQDDRTLHALIARHGVFAESFFTRSVRERVARRFARSVAVLEECRERAAESSPAWGYAVREGGGASDMIRLVANRLFEQAALRAVEDERGLAILRDWAARHAEPRTCVLCGEPFSLLDLPEWVYHGANGYRGCCLRCRILARPEPSRLMAVVPAFVEACGFVPTAEASPVCYAFTSRLTAKAWPVAIRLWAQMGGTGRAKRVFGSWFAALAASGALPDGVLVTQKGIRCLAHDGHACHSLEERSIDDYLHARRIPHQREPKYPAHSILNPKRTRRADWRVGKVFVEYAGLAGDPDYDRKLDEKILLARHANQDLLVLYPSDLERLAQRLDSLTREGNGAC